MKIEKWRELGKAELEHKLVELQDNLLKIQFKVQTRQVENTAQLGTMRRDIARVKTLLKEMAAPGAAASKPAAEPAAAPAQPEAAAKPAKVAPAKPPKAKPAAKTDAKDKK